MKSCGTIEQHYYPAGPLKYLLMERNGDSLLGIYRRKDNHTFCLVLNCFKDSIFFPVSFMQLRQLMENKMSVKNVLMSNECLSAYGNVLNPAKKLLVHFFIVFFLNGTINALQRVVVHPNYFYEFNIYIYHPETNQIWIEK